MYWEIPCPPLIDLLSFEAFLAPRPKVPGGMRRRLTAARIKLQMNLKYEWFLKRKSRVRAEDKVRAALGAEFQVRVRLREGAWVMIQSLM